MIVVRTPSLLFHAKVQYTRHIPARLRVAMYSNVLGWHDTRVRYKKSLGIFSGERSRIYAGYVTPRRFDLFKVS